MSNFNIYFPRRNLNPQGWLSDFITPYVVKTGKRSNEASIFYDSEFTPEAYDLLKKQFKDDKEFKDFLNRRKKVEEEKIISLNGNHLDKMSVDQTLIDSTLTPEESQKYLQFMSSAKPYQLAFLQHYMILSYGVKKEATDTDYTFYEFPFTQIFDENFILNDNKSAFPRAEGTGIKRISVANEFNFVTHINSKVTIDFFFGHLKLLTREMKANGSIADSEEVNKKDFPFGFNFMKLLSSFDLSREIIRLEYGKKVSDGFLEYIKDPALKDIIEKKEKKVLYLNKINHNFTFSYDGKINLSVTYLDIGRSRLFKPNTINIPCDGNKIEGYTKYKEVLKKYQEEKKAAEDIKKSILLRESSIREVGKIKDLEAAKKEDAEILSNTNKKLESIRKNLRDSFPTIFVDKVKQQGQLFSIDFKADKNGDMYKTNCSIYLIKPTDGSTLQLFQYETEKKLNDLISAESLLKEADKNAYTNLKLTSLLSQIFNTPGNTTDSTKSKKFGNFMFFPLRSVIAAAYSFLCEDEKKDVPYLLLGNIITSINNKQISINIGDLLVETQTFQKWYYENCLSKDKLEYSYGAFISDIINDLIPRILYRNKVINTNSPSTVLLKNFFLSTDGITAKLKRDLYLDGKDQTLREFSKKLTQNINPNNTNALIYASQINSISSNSQVPYISNNLKDYTYNEIKDNLKGIIHIKFGADGGIVKDASFSATDNSRIRSAYSYESLANNASKVLLYYYQMNLNMLGNNTFAYDSIVAVPINSLGLDSSENDPGLAGYYKVISTNDDIDSTSYNTSATCVWVFSVENDKKKESVVNSLSDNDKIKDYADVSVNDPIRYIETELSITTEAQTTTNDQPTPNPENKPQKVAMKEKPEKKQLSQIAALEERIKKLEQRIKKVKTS